MVSSILILYLGMLCDFDMTMYPSFFGLFLFRNFYCGRAPDLSVLGACFLMWAEQHRLYNKCCWWWCRRFLFHQGVHFSAIFFQCISYKDLVKEHTLVELPSHFLSMLWVHFQLEPQHFVDNIDFHLFSYLRRVYIYQVWSAISFERSTRSNAFFYQWNKRRGPGELAHPSQLSFVT